MNILNSVYDSLKWKKGDDYCARQLGIPIEEYQEVKKDIIETRYLIQDDLDTAIKEILNRGASKDPELMRVETNRFKSAIEYTVLNKSAKTTGQEVDMEKGTAKIEGLAYFEPHTPEQIIELLKIDTAKWKLSRYWSKQKSAGYWLVSALVSEIRQDSGSDLKKVLDNLKLNYQPVGQSFLNTTYTDPTCAVLSLQDIHIGKEELDKTVSIEASVKNCIRTLVMKAFHSSRLEKIILVLGGDLVNMDTYLGTTTGGTPVDNSMAATEAYKMAYELMYWAVNFCSQFCHELEVVYIPGNHSRLTEAHIAYSLSRHIKDPKIKWNIEYDEFKVITYGNSMICLEHGDFDTKKSYFYFSSQYPKEWGSSVHRVCYTGHFHKHKKIEYVTDEISGFTLRTLPSLCGTDGYHKRNKWVNNKRGGIIELHSITNGPTGQFSYYE